MTPTLLIDGHTFDAGPQGTTTFLAGLLNALPEATAARGRSIRLVVAGKTAAAAVRFVNGAFDFAAVRGGFLRRNGVGLPALSSAPGVAAVLSQYVRPFRSAAPTISVIHDVLFLDFPDLFSWRYRFVRRLMFGWAARHSTVVITVSDYSRRRLVHHFGLAAERIDVLPNAVSVAPRPAQPVRPQGAPLRLLYVARFERRKRQHWCVAAAVALAAAGLAVQLTLVGNAQGVYADEVRRSLRTDRSPALAVTIRSDVSQDTLAELYAATDLFLFPSECEGFGIPVIEAAASGLPCVVVAATALAELNGRYAGVSVEPDSEAAFVEAVASAVARLPELKAQAEAGADAVRAAYAWPDVARRFLDILERRRVLA